MHHESEQILGQINGCFLGIYEKALPADMLWDERLKTAKQAGYDFVEISIDETDERMARLGCRSKDPDEIISAMRRQKIPILTMCLSGNRRFPIGSENVETRTKGITLIKDAVDFSLDIGIRIVQLAGYDEYYNPPSKRTRALFTQALEEVVDYAASRGVCLAFETMETDMMDSIKKIIRYVNNANSPYLQIYPDIGNLTSTGINVQRDFMTGIGHIMAIHLKDSMPGKIREIPYGEGIVDFTAFFKFIRKINFKGLLVAEMWASEDRQASINYVRTAREFLLEKYSEAEGV
jgi:L-ribulose-5-phosphate 3-epimerase